jgi:hypothetical protein
MVSFGSFDKFGFSWQKREEREESGEILGSSKSPRSQETWIFHELD